MAWEEAEEEQGTLSFISESSGDIMGAPASKMYPSCGFSRCDHKCTVRTRLSVLEISVSKGGPKEAKQGMSMSSNKKERRIPAKREKATDTLITKILLKICILKSD